MNPIKTFSAELARQYTMLFAMDPEYAYAAARHTPESLALKMTTSLATGDANKDGEGIKRACKALGIKNTYAAIRAYLTQQDIVPKAVWSTKQ